MVANVVVGKVGEKVITEVAKSFFDYLKTKEQERTKREAIIAKRDVLTAEINAKKELLSEIFKGIFDERQNTINKLFDVLDKGIEKGDSDLIDKSLSGILTIIQTSPFANFKEFDAKMKDKNFVLDLDD